MNGFSRQFVVFFVWILFITGCVSMIGAPIARYVTGQEYYLWLMLGVSFVSLLLARAAIELVTVPEEIRRDFWK